MLMMYNVQRVYKSVQDNIHWIFEQVCVCVSYIMGSGLPGFHDKKKSQKLQ